MLSIKRRLMSRIRAFALIVVIAFVFSSTSVYARGGGHSEDVGGATRADMVDTLATKHIQQVIPAASMDGLQAAQRRGAIS